MNIYHAWRALKVGVSDIAFGEGVAKYLDHLRAGIDRKRAAHPPQTRLRPIGPRRISSND